MPRGKSIAYHIIEGGLFIAGSIYVQVQGPMEGRHFNVSLFCFTMSCLVIFEKK
jgi:1,4-dihydroxy-2-naphthoate octaprenyltransferase